MKHQESMFREKAIRQRAAQLLIAVNVGRNEKEVIRDLLGLLNHMREPCHTCGAIGCTSLRTDL